MVPLEQLGEKNLLHTYYIASEIKEKLEIEASNTVTIPHALFVSGTIKHYPSSEETRKQTLRYMKEAGYITSVFHSGAKVYIDVPNQETIFSLCTKSLTLYHQRFRQVTPEKLAVDKLTDEQVENLHKILEIVTIRLSMSRPPHIIYIPLQHFPGEIQPSDILGLLYKSDKDFHILRFTKIIGEKVAEQEAEIRIKDEKMEKALSDFRKTIEDRYLKIIEKRKQEPTPKPQPKKEPLEVIIREGSKIAIEKAEEEKKYRFPHKLPRGTKWENITIKFLDDDTVHISTKGKEHSQNFKDMGLEGKGGKPSVLWIFLRVLAMYSGEIKASDDKKDDSYKKQKQSLSEALESYFGLDFDPFYPFQTDKSYRVKFTLLPPDNGFTFEKKRKASLLERPVKNSPFDDLGSYMNETAPVIAQTGTITPDDER